MNAYQNACLASEVFMLVCVLVTVMDESQTSPNSHVCTTMYTSPVLFTISYRAILSLPLPPIDTFVSVELSLSALLACADHPLVPSLTPPLANSHRHKHAQNQKINMYSTARHQTFAQQMGRATARNRRMTSPRRARDQTVKEDIGARMCQGWGDDLGVTHLFLPSTSAMPTPSPALSRLSPALPHG